MKGEQGQERRAPDYQAFMTRRYRDMGKALPFVKGHCGWDVVTLPRFYSDDLAAARLPWEFQCGTGSVAVAIALVLMGNSPSRLARASSCLNGEATAQRRTHMGFRTSRIELELNDRSITKAAFSHSVVEILAEGSLTVPGY